MTLEPSSPGISPINVRITPFILSTCRQEDRAHFPRPARFATGTQPSVLCAAPDRGVVETARVPHQAATVSRLTPRHHTNRQHEHQLDSHAQRSQVSQDVLQSFRNAFLRPRQENLRLRSGRGASQKGLIIACSTTLLSAGTLSLLDFLSFLVSIACLLVSCSRSRTPLLQISSAVQYENLTQLYYCLIGSCRSRSFVNSLAQLGRKSSGRQHIRGANSC